jgi:hypothetical protein
MNASPTFIFQRSSSTCLDCLGKNLFGSSKPWPLQIKTIDYCLLHHYEIDTFVGWLGKSLSKAT